MPTSVEVLAERVEVLIGNVAELKDLLGQVSTQVRTLDREAITDRARIEGKVDAAHRRLDEHDKRLTDINKVLPNLIVANNILTYGGGILLLSVLALIWSLITGQAHLTFDP